MGPGTPTVLYAPTWRDNRRTETRQYAIVNHLGLGRISKALGDESSTLLLAHSDMPGLTARDPSPNVVDVSDYPDIAELMLVGTSS